MRFVVLPGDGIGPEISAATIEVLSLLNTHFGRDLIVETHEVGLTTLKSVGTTMPPGVLDSCRTADGAMLGPVSHSDYPACAPSSPLGTKAFTAALCEEIANV